VAMMPLDLTCVIALVCLFAIWLGACRFTDSVEKHRRENPPYDPDDWPAHLGIPPNFRAREREIQPTKRVKKSA